MTDSAVPGSAPGAGLPVGLRPPISEIKAELFRALAHPARIRVLELLAEGERSVGEIQPLVGHRDRRTCRSSSAVLRRAGLVTTRKVGSSVFYAIRDPELVELLAVGEAAPHQLAGRVRGSARRPPERLTPWCRRWRGRRTQLPVIPVPGAAGPGSCTPASRRPGARTAAAAPRRLRRASRGRGGATSSPASPSASSRCRSRWPSASRRGLGATAGLMTAIVAGLVAAVFGGSNVQVSGPTGAMTVVLVPDRRPVRRERRATSSG